MSDKTELSIDTPEYRKLLGAVTEASQRGYAHGEADEEKWIAANRALINYIDAWTRRATIQPTSGEPVAEICGVWELRFVGSGPIAPIVERHGLKIGDKLYARAPVAPADAVRDARNEALQFAERIISDALSGADWDGGAVQELAVQHGLLKPTEMQGPCGEDGHCACAQNGAEFPALCYRKTYLADLRATTKGPAK